MMKYEEYKTKMFELDRAFSTGEEQLQRIDDMGGQGPVFITLQIIEVHAQMLAYALGMFTEEERLPLLEDGLDKKILDYANRGYGSLGMMQRKKMHLETVETKDKPSEGD